MKLFRTIEAVPEWVYGMYYILALVGSIVFIVWLTYQGLVWLTSSVPDDVGNEVSPSSTVEVEPTPEVTKPQVEEAAQDAIESAVIEVNEVNEVNEVKPSEQPIETQTTTQAQPIEVEPAEVATYFPLSDYERWVVECMVMGESGGEPYKGQMAVAQCILQACRNDDLTPSEVRVVYKYSGWNENPSTTVRKAVHEVFDNGVKAVNDEILWFYAPAYVKGSPWHETQRFVVTIGNHKFFGKW